MYGQRFTFKVILCRFWYMIRQRPYGAILLLTEVLSDTIWSQGTYFYQGLVVKI